VTTLPPLLGHARGDVQAGRPATRVSLSGVGVSGLEQVVRLSAGSAEALSVPVTFECSVALVADQRGAHMSRFLEAVAAAAQEAAVAGTFGPETLAAHVAEGVRARQGAGRAEVRVAADYPDERLAPASAQPTQEIFTVLGAALASERGTRRLAGVEAQGITACPCAQDLVAGRARERLEADGFSGEEIERIFDHVPMATHNQRGVGTLWIGAPGEQASVEARELLEIVRSSMSAEIHGLMKRSDELEVVERAHRRPRFVEDCVREMVRSSVERFSGLGEQGFLLAVQRNLETIHRHDVTAERRGLIGALRREVDGGEEARHVSMAAWLEASHGADEA
jgi:GTP cyclohydrolase-4